jgi:hypothetical protein
MKGHGVVGPVWANDIDAKVRMNTTHNKRFMISLLSLKWFLTFTPPLKKDE